QVPQALTLHPTLVTVLITDDAFRGTPTATFETRLRDALVQLRQGGRARVLVANIPPLDARPGYLACLPGAAAASDCTLDRPVPDVATLDARVDALDAAVAHAAAATGANVVDLHAAVLAERAAGRETAEYDPGAISPNAQGHRVRGRVPAQQRMTDARPPRDAQRRRVYLAETPLPGRKLPALDQCAAFVDTVVGSLWWELRFPHLTMADVPRLRPGHGARQAFYCELPSGPAITLPRRYRTTGVVLHELCHWALARD